MGKTILIVSHDLSSISKYCDRVVLLNQGKKLAEGAPKDMVDLYKKLLVNQLDLETLEAVRPESEDSLTAAAVNAGEKKAADIWKPSFELNPDINEYGDGQAEIIGFNVLDEDGNSSNTLQKGSRCSIRMRVKFKERIDDPIYAFTITNLKGTEISGTNSLFERVNVQAKGPGEIQEIAFTQNMDMQGGEYMLSLGCTGYNGSEFVVHHRLYEVCNLTIVSSKNTVGFYDMNSEVTLLDGEEQSETE